MDDLGMLPGNHLAVELDDILLREDTVTLPCKHERQVLLQKRQAVKGPIERADLQNLY